MFNNATINNNIKAYKSENRPKAPLEASMSRGKAHVCKRSQACFQKESPQRLGTKQALKDLNENMILYIPLKKTY